MGLFKTLEDICEGLQSLADNPGHIPPKIRQEARYAFIYIHLVNEALNLAGIEREVHNNEKMASRLERLIASAASANPLLEQQRIKEINELREFREEQEHRSRRNV